MGRNDRVGKPIRGDAVPQHAARVFVFLKYSRAVALQRKEVRAGKPGRAAADDCNFLRPRPLQRGLHHRRNIAVGGVQVLLGNKFLYLVDGDGLIHGAAGAGILTAAVAHTAADSGQRVLALDERQGLVIATLRRELQIALNGNVRGAGRLAGRGAGLMRLDAVIVAVVGRPLGVVPLGGIGQLLARILGYLSAGLFAAELLAELGCTSRAHLNAATAGHALVLLDLGDIGRARQVGCVEQLRGAQGVAHVDVAVADGEDLVLAVDVGDLVHKAVVLGALEDLHRLIIGDLAALAGLETVVTKLTDGDARPVLVNTKGFDKRSTAEPENERVLSGPREGFTECFMPNLALIRRRVNDPRLKFRFMRVGSRTNTNVCLCYIAGLCENSLVERLETRLTALDIDSVLDSNYLAERIRDHRWSPFPTLGTTERPDVAASRMLEGRCVIVVDGSPVALTAPFLFQECFQSNDDYYISFLQANLSRILRVIGFVFTITFPAMYAALMLYHRELVPARLLFAVSAAQRGVPLPIGGEILLMLFVLEALKEAGARTPGAMGQTMSIVGGLVLGDAAVSARFAAAPTVIVVAIAGVTGLMVPKLQTAALWLRFVLLAAAASWGLYGVGLALGLTLAALCRMHSCSVPYLLNLVPRISAEHEDTWLRYPWFFMRCDRFAVKRPSKEERP